jgi:hypothetical protein
MDTTDPSITFDDDGVCNHCTKWFETWENKIDKRPLEEVFQQVRDRKKGKYDAIVGISGGVDSSLVAYLAYGLGLNCLLVHADDGWNTDAAWTNVQRIVETTGYDFEHVKFDSDQFHDIILAYMMAGVVGLESPTDNALRAIIYDVASKNNINTILSGGNWVTEGIMPGLTWGSDNNDARNIKSIHKRHGSMRIDNVKLIGIIKRAWMLSFRGLREFRPLNHLNPPYNRSIAIEELSENWGLIDYGRKHNENRYTKFVECHIFPERFGIDKRKAHYSTLICSGQMSRVEALQMLSEPLYSIEELEQEKKFFLEQLGIDEVLFESYMNSPIGSHDDYARHNWEKKFVRLGMKITGRRM